MNAFLGAYGDPIRSRVAEMTATQCPREDWSYYYKLYTCWVLMESEKGL